MKINEVKVGQAYNVRNKGNCVVIDIGQYREGSARSVGERKVEWNGRTFTTGWSWYADDSAAKVRRIVVMSVYTYGDGASRVFVVPAAHIISELTDDAVKRQFVTDEVNRVLLEQRNQQVMRADEYQKSLRVALSSITGIKEEKMSYQQRDNPWLLLVESDVLPQMTLLWLEYKRQRGESIDGVSDIESLADGLKDSFRGLRAAQRAESASVISLETITREAVDSHWKSSAAQPVVTLSAVETNRESVTGFSAVRP